MKKKSKKTQNKCINANDLRPVFDLFGEISVSQEDIFLWCEAVPKISRHSWRLSWYVKNWFVVEKIRHAKQHGAFDRTILSADRYRELRWL